MKARRGQCLTIFDFFNRKRHSTAQVCCGLTLHADAHDDVLATAVVAIATQIDNNCRLTLPRTARFVVANV